MCFIFKLLINLISSRGACINAVATTVITATVATATTAATVVATTTAVITAIITRYNIVRYIYISKHKIK